MTRRRLLSDDRGATAVEFALAAPVLISMVIGVSQLGQLFFANAGIQHTVEQAARFAAVYPAPGVDEIEAKIHEGQLGMRGTLEPVLTRTVVADGPDILDISLTYDVPLDFIFFETPPVTLTHSRRVFLLKEPTTASSSSTSSSTSTTSASSTSSGGDSSTSTSTSSSSGNNSNGGGNGNNGKDK